MDLMEEASRSSWSRTGPWAWRPRRRPAAAASARRPEPRPPLRTEGWRRPCAAAAALGVTNEAARARAWRPPATVGCAAPQPGGSACSSRRAARAVSLPAAAPYARRPRRERVARCREVMAYPRGRGGPASCWPEVPKPALRQRAPGSRAAPATAARWCAACCGPCPARGGARARGGNGPWRSCSRTGPTERAGHGVAGPGHDLRARESLGEGSRRSMSQPV